MSLTEEETKQLLKIARDSIQASLENRKYIFEKTYSEGLTGKNGVFVTLHGRNGQLRGCIGNIVSDKCLYRTVHEMALESAFSDPRFESVTKKELDELIIEISILSPLKNIENTDEIKIGVHGVFLKRGGRSGVFLPQVAVETGWKLEEFLSNLCAGKAGLPPDAWKDKDTQIYTFEAEIISERP